MAIFLEVLLLYEAKFLSLRIEQLTGSECFEACVYSRATTVQILFIKTWSSPTLFLLNIESIVRTFSLVCLNCDVTGSADAG